MNALGSMFGLILAGLFFWYFLSKVDAFVTRHYLAYTLIFWGSFAVCLVGLLRDLDKVIPLPKKLPLLSEKASAAIYRFLDDVYSRTGEEESWAIKSGSKDASGLAKEKGIKRIEDGQFGNAKFMGERDLKLLSSTGNIVIGQTHNNKQSPWILYPLKKHLITIAATRMGKGASSIATNALATEVWKGPLVVVDPKPELIFIAHGHRSKSYKQIVLDPMGLIAAQSEQAELRGKFIEPIEVHTLNFFDFIRDDEDGVGDIYDLLEGLIITVTTSGEGSHWDDKAREVLAAFMGWVKAKFPKEQQHMGTVYDLITLGKGNDENVDELKKILQQMSKDTKAFHGLPAKGAAAALSSEDKERSGIFSSALKALTFLNLNKMRRHGMQSSFDIMDLCRGKIDLTVVLPPEMMTKNHPCRRWLRAVCAMPGSLVRRLAPTKPILFMLDEASDIGRLDPVVSAFRQGAGRGLHMWLFAQTLAGLRETWGAEAVKDMLGNADFVEYLRPPATPFEEVKAISDALGEYTYQKVSENENSGSGGKMWSPFADNRSKGKGKSFSKERARLMTPEELISMKPNEKIIIHTSDAVEKPLPINCFQAKYHERPELVGRIGPNPHFRGDEDPDFVAPVALDPIQENAPEALVATASPAPAALVAPLEAVVDVEDLLPTINMTVATWIEDQFGSDFRIADLTEDQFFSLVSRGDLLEAGGVALFMSQFETVVGDKIEQAKASGFPEFEFEGDDLNEAELVPAAAEAA